MTTPVRFPYLPGDTSDSDSNLLAYLPITLTRGEQSLTLPAMLDSGSSVNLLPYTIGLQLGLAWEAQTTPVVLTGSLGRLPARGIVLLCQVEPFPPVDLAFAWTQSSDVPLLLGQINFFLEYDVCFFRARSVFEVQPRNL